jgi:hypothetical protein
VPSGLEKFKFLTLLGASQGFRTGMWNGGTFGGGNLKNDDQG